MSLLPTDIQWFRVFYLLAVATGGWLVYRSARRDGLGRSSAVALFFSATVFGILGSRLAALPLAEWPMLIGGGSVLGGSKTMVGGVLGAVVGVLVARWSLVLKGEVWGWFASWPLVLVLFRVGCLAVGCCMGTETQLPWGVACAPGSPACLHQVSAGLLGSSGESSLPVHPVPVYEMLWAGAVLLLGWAWRRKGLGRQAWFFVSLALYAAFRFCTEFIRVESPQGGPLNLVQWAMLLALPVCLLGAWWSLRRVVPTGVGVSRSAMWAVVPPLAIALGLRGFWTVGEWMALGLMLLLLGWALWSDWQRAPRDAGSRLPWMAAASLVLGVFLMSQAAIDLTVPVEEERSLVELGMGVAVGEYRETCGDNHRYGVMGAGAQYSHNWGGRQQLDLGLRGYYGTDEDTQREFTVFGMNPYIGYQTRWFGAEMGAHLGNLLSDGNFRTVLPSVEARLGPSDIFFVEGRAFNNMYTPIPGSSLRLGIGSGFGLRNGTVFRTGIGANGWYVHPSIVIAKNFVVEPFVAYGDRDNYQLSLTARVRLGL